LKTLKLYFTHEYYFIVAGTLSCRDWNTVFDLWGFGSVSGVQQGNCTGFRGRIGLKGSSGRFGYTRAVIARYGDGVVARRLPVSGKRETAIDCWSEPCLWDYAAAGAVTPIIDLSVVYIHWLVPSW
jgi:hypothetical protein